MKNGGPSNCHDEDRFADPLFVCPSRKDCQDSLLSSHDEEQDDHQELD